MWSGRSTPDGNGSPTPADREVVPNAGTSALGEPSPLEKEENGHALESPPYHAPYYPIYMRSLLQNS